MTDDDDDMMISLPLLDYLQMQTDMSELHRALHYFLEKEDQNTWKWSRHLAEKLALTSRVNELHEEWWSKESKFEKEALG